MNGNAGVNHPIFESDEEINFDINALSTTKRFDVAGYPEVTVQIELESGSFSSAVTAAQLSADGENFHDIEGLAQLTGPGILDEIPIGTEWFRLRVVTVEGAPGTAKVTVNAKR